MFLNAHITLALTVMRAILITLNFLVVLDADLRIKRIKLKN